jgi:hypothetical protein
MSTASLKLLLLLAGVLLACAASLLVGMRSGLRQDALFDAVMDVWSRISPGDATKPVQFNRYGQLIAYPDKIELPRPEITARTMVAFVFGQSNSANSGGERHEAAGDHVLNYWAGKYYRAVDPLLGASGQTGSVWVTTANRLIAGQKADKVIYLAAGIGGTSVREWRKGGRLHGMLEARLLEARRQNIPVTHFLWHQGEQDNPAASKSALDVEGYKQGLKEIIALTKIYFPQSRFFVAQASRCFDAPSSSELLKAQAEMAQLDGVFLGPNTDLIGPMDRFDGCHLSGRGLDKHADAWVRALFKPAKPMP